MKPLPCSLEVEKSVIGEILVAGNLDKFDGLKPEHFLDRKHRILFQTFMAMDAKGEKPDKVTVTSKLIDQQLIGEVGGVSYVSSLPYFTSGNPEQYVPVLEEKLRLRKIIELASEAMIQAESQLDSSKILKTLEHSALCVDCKDNSGSLTRKACEEVLKLIEKKRRGEKVFGFKTGIAPWDSILGGLKKARFYVLAARAGKGKTAMTEQIIFNLLIENIPILIFEKDMSSEMLIQRMSARAAGVPFSRFDNNNCSHAEYDEIKKWTMFFDKAPFYIHAPPDFTASTLCSVVKKEKKLHDVKAVFVDHILNLNVGTEYREGLTQASTRIRASVEETEIPHVILAQLNRDGHGTERPSPKHVKEFDALYADCDVMTMLWSEKDTNEVPKGHLFPVKFTCNKNRYGSEFEDELGFDRPLMTFKPMIQK